MNYKDFSKELKANNLSGAYLLHGQEEYIKDRAVESVVKQIIPDGLKEMNYLKIDGADSDIKEVQNAILTLPFMAKKRIVAVYDYPIFKLSPAQIKQSTNASKIEFFNKIISKCPKETILLFVNRGALGKTILKAININEVIFAPLNDIDKEKTLSAMAKEKGIKISKYNIKVLMDYTLDELLMINNELDKLKAYVGDDEVTDKDIYAVCVSGAEYDVFKMLNNIANKNASKALSIYRRLIFNGESPQAIISMIERQFRALFYMDEISKAPTSEYNSIASKLRTKSFIIRNMEKLSKTISHDRRKEIANWCADADYLVKKGRMSIDNTAEILIMKLINL
jgi:DNA polymerase-3 subunit delta